MIIVTMVLTFVKTHAQASIYEENFDVRTSFPEWTTTITNPAWQKPIQTEVTPTGRTFLGQFGQQEVTLSLNNVPVHDSLLLSFDLFVIRTWDGSSTVDGPDEFDIAEASGFRYVTTFSNQLVNTRNQAYPDMGLGSTHSAYTGSAEINSLGYYRNDIPNAPMDAVYHVVVSIPHTGGNVYLNFIGNLHDGNPTMSNESWGLENVQISVFSRRGSDDAPCGTTAIVNGGFATDVSGWTLSAPNCNAGTITWSPLYGGSAEVSISGSPGCCNIEQVLREGLCIGDSLIWKFTRTDGGPHGLSLSLFTPQGQTIRYWGQDYFGSGFGSSTPGTFTVPIVLDTCIPAGSILRLGCSVWPGGTTYYYHYIDICRGPGVPCCTASLHPTISYILPDIGTPDMNTYVELIGPHDSTGNFGPDGIYTNNTGDAVRVVPVNPNDTNRVVIGPCVVSWNGRLVSTQVFVLPNAITGMVSLQAIVNGNISNPVDFEIVQPQHLGVLNSPGIIGSGGAWGTRSKRGAMIVDSLILQGSGTYSIASSDCDPVTPGNQGYMPAVILSKGRIDITSGVIMNSSASGADAGPGGGGGGNGLTCGTKGGSGFTGGGGNAQWGTGCGDRPAGEGSGNGQDGLNGVPGGQCSGSNEGGGGGTGYPFGVGGGPGGGSAWNGGLPGFGGGTGGPNCCLPAEQGGGGGGGFASDGSDGGVWQGYLSGGNRCGNDQLIPLGGGSGGGGGNVNQNNPNQGAGNGGGGGGAILLFGLQMFDSGLIHSMGASGENSSDNGAGGGGSGGSIALMAKIASAAASIDVSGGRGGIGIAPGQSGGEGGAGRLRVDGPLTQAQAVIPALATQFRGPSTDSSHLVQRDFVLTGTGNGHSIRIYLKPQSRAWILLTSVSGYVSNWTQNITLPGQDSLYFLAVAQEVPNPQGTQYAAEPSWVLSQAAANILLRVAQPIISSPSTLQFDSLLCGAQALDTILVQNTGSVLLSIDSASFQGADSASFTLIEPKSFPITLPPGESRRFVVRFSPSALGSLNAVLRLSNNSTQNPYDITLTGRREQIALTVSSDTVDFGTLCPESLPHDTAIFVENISTIPTSYVATVNSPFAIAVGSSGQLGIGGRSAITVHLDKGLSEGLHRATLFVQDTCGMMKQALLLVNVARPHPVLPDTILLCSGGDTTIDAGPYRSFLWSTSETTRMITVRDSGSYTVTVFDPFGCSGTSNPLRVILRPVPTPTITSTRDTICVCDTLHLTATPDFGYNQWSSGETTRSIVVRGDSLGIGVHSYTVSVFDSNSCKGISPAKFITVVAPDAGMVLAITPQTVEAEPGDTVRVALHVHSPLNRRACRMTDYVAQLRYNRNLLYFLSADGAITTDALLDSMYARLKVTGSWPQSNDSTVTLRFLAMLGDTVESPIALDLITSGACAMQSAAAQSTFRMTGLCPEGGTRLIRTNGMVALKPVRPDPLDDHGEIEFRVIERGRTQILITDIMGRTLATLTDGEIEPGLHVIPFDASDLAPGTYWCLLVTPSTRISQLLEVLR